MNMDFDAYQQLASRSSRNSTGEGVGSHSLRVAVAAMGLAGEAGEVVDYLKKVIGHSHPPDPEKLKKELGDVLWYAAELASLNALSLGEIANLNIQKLLARYPNGFTPAASLNRKPEDV